MENLTDSINAVILLMRGSALLLFVAKVMLTTQNHWKGECGSQKGNYSEGLFFLFKSIS